jgi:hypothetical protein
MLSLRVHRDGHVSLIVSRVTLGIAPSLQPPASVIDVGAIIELMPRVILRPRLAALRQPTRQVRIATALWIAWAIIIWNVVFDQVIVFAGRRYIRAAALAAQAGGPYARIDDWMRPAVTGALWMASAAAGTILVIGRFGARLAAPRPEHQL